MPDPTQEKYWRIKSLKCWPRVLRMLEAGKPAPAVADYIQNERGEYKDVKMKSLAAMLQEYRRVELEMPSHVVSGKREFTDRMEELNRLDRLIQLQEFRVENSAADEAMTQQKDQSLSKEIKILNELYVTMHRIKADLGLTGSRELGTIRVAPEKMAEIERKYGEAGVKVFSEQPSQGRLLAAFNALKKAAPYLNESADPVNENPAVIDVEAEESSE